MAILIEGPGKKIPEGRKRSRSKLVVETREDGRPQYPGEEEHDAEMKKKAQEVSEATGIPVRELPRVIREGRWKQEELERPPIRALAIKGRQLREAMRNGNVLDWGDIHERFVDLWQEARLVIWRAKHKRPGVRAYDPVEGKEVQTYIPDDKLVLMAIDTTKGVLDSIIRLRREMGSDKSGIPRWAIERIERALRDYPEAQHALLRELAAEKEAEEIK